MVCSHRPRTAGLLSLSDRQAGVPGVGSRERAGHVATGGGRRTQPRPAVSRQRRESLRVGPPLAGHGADGPAVSGAGPSATMSVPRSPQTGSPGGTRFPCVGIRRAGAGRDSWNAGRAGSPGAPGGTRTAATGRLPCPDGVDFAGDFGIGCVGGTGGNAHRPLGTPRRSRTPPPGPACPPSAVHFQIPGKP